MIVVVGHGVTGRAVERWARERGREVLVVDDAPDRSQGAVDAPTGLRALPGAELVVPSPGVRPDHPVLVEATERGVPVDSELDLAADELARGEGAAVRLVAVTGTNGKTTVTTLVAAMLTASGISARTAGNIGEPLLDVVRDLGATPPASVVVVEASSFQLALSGRFRPDVAVLLNVADDHLDWHGGFEAYAAAKASIAARQRDDDVLVYNADDPVVADLARRAPARTVPFSIAEDVDAVLAGAEVPSHLDLENALAAAAAARAAGASTQGIAQALDQAGRLPHRVVPVGEAGGVRWIDDSKATNPHAANHAIGRFESVVLIAGGRNKGLDLRALRHHEARLRAVVAMGESAGEVDAAFAGSPVPVHRVTTMREAVATAATLARAGDTVLLSPACTSLDAYRDYGARGDDFAAEVLALVDRQERVT